MDNENAVKNIAPTGEEPVVSVKEDKNQRQLVYIPTRQRHTNASAIIGWISRALTAAMFVAGIEYLIADAFMIIPEMIDVGDIMIPSLAFALTIAMIVHGGRTSVLGVLSFVGVLFAQLFAFTSNLSEFIIGSVAAVHNAVIDKFVSVGQTAVYALRADAPATIFSEEELFKGGAILLSLFLSLLFVPAIMKRCRGLYLVPVTALFFIPICTYNIMRSNWAFSLFVSAAAGVAALCLYDRVYTATGKNKRILKENESLPSVDGGAPKKRKPPKLKAQKAKKQRGKDKNVEDALRLESPAVRRARKRAERRLKADERKLERVKARELWRAEKRSERPDRKAARRSRSLGGAIGFVTFAMSMLAISIPAQLVAKNETGIPYLSSFMNTARGYVEAIIKTDKPDLNNMPSPLHGGSTGGPRSTEALYPSFADVPVMYVGVPFDTSVYLRQWIGTEYDDNMWYSATLDDIAEYNDKFGDGFTPDSIRENFYSSVFPLFDSRIDESGYSENASRGFILERVSVRRLYNDSQLLPIPAFARPSKGLMSYGGRSPLRRPYTHYFDGIWTSNFFLRDTSYASESFVTTMRSPSLGKNFNDSIKLYCAMIELIRSGEPDSYLNADEETKERYIDQKEFEIEEEYGVSAGVYSLLRRYLTTMTDAERAALIEYDDTERLYAEYVRDTYLNTDPDDNSEIYAETRRVLNAAGIDPSTVKFAEYDGYHSAIMAIVEYFNDEFVYTLEPPKSDEQADTTGEGAGDALAISGSGSDNDEEEKSEPEMSAVVEFLTKTKAGYCVQFASSLTLMLRSVGIPARYCEGYVAADYYKATGVDDPFLRYNSEVLDSNAHAWVEVYYDHLGWVQYEATPLMHDEIYGGGTGGVTDTEPVEDPKPPVNDRPDDDDGNDDEKDDEDIPLPEEDDGRLALIVVAIIAAVIVFAALVWFITALIVTVHRSNAARRRRATLISRSLDTESPMTDDELHELAHELDLCILELLTALGLPPESGELPDEYASRLMPVVGGASQIHIATALEYISSEEFGRALTRDGLAALASYYDELTRAVYAGLSRRDRIDLRYKKRVV